jgi:ATP-dependent helicase/nuclease subunit B
MPRPAARRAAEIVELVALRGGTGRPDIGELLALFEERLSALSAEDVRKPFWLARLNPRDIEDARTLVTAIGNAVEPLAALRAVPETGLAEIGPATVTALEALGRASDGSLGELYGGDGGEALAVFLRELLGTSTRLAFPAAEWPAMLSALMAGVTVKPPQGADSRIAIWGALEARLQSVDTLVLGGLNEGSWPHRADADRFMSRLMKSGLDLEPPERRIGQAAHDFWMASGTRDIVLTRAVRAGDAPAVASRWLQRLMTYVGEDRAAEMLARGETLAHWARQLDNLPRVNPIVRPRPTPKVVSRPNRFSVTEIETLRRDPYALYARRVLGLYPLDPVIRDPGAAERGSLFHDILHEFIRSGADPRGEDAEERLLATGRRVFDAAALPPDVDAVWWPRFAGLARSIVDWERDVRPPGISRRLTEADAEKTAIGTTGATLHGRADRIDLLAGGFADILDYKTGSYPSKGQAHTLLSPQLALEAALLARGAFKDAGTPVPRELAYVRLRSNGEVKEESILEHRKNRVTAEAMANDAWRRLQLLIAHYATESNGYISRALPFREGDTEGDYDHLARVLEWSASGGGEAGE